MFSKPETCPLHEEMRRKIWPNITDLATKLRGTVEENLAEQHRAGHQTGGNGGGKPGQTTQSWPPNCGERWRKTGPNNTELATKLGETVEDLRRTAQFAPSLEDVMHGLSNTEEEEVLLVVKFVS